MLVHLLQSVEVFICMGRWDLFMCPGLLSRSALIVHNHKHINKLELHWHHYPKCSQEIAILLDATCRHHGSGNRYLGCMQPVHKDCIFGLVACSLILLFPSCCLWWATCAAGWLGIYYFVHAFGYTCGHVCMCHKASVQWQCRAELLSLILVVLCSSALPLQLLWR